MRNTSDRFQSFRQALLALAVTVLATTLAAAPDYMYQLNYQGQLTNSAGEPVGDGAHNVIFRLYNAASAGTLLWSENQSVTVQKGLFNAILGQVSSLDLDVLGGNDGWLELEVNGNGPMTPRQQLQRAPFAHYAERLNGQPVGTGAYNIVQLDGSGKIPAGMVSGGSVSVPLDLSQSNSTYILRAQNTGSGVGISATTASGGVPAIYGRGTRYGADFSTANDISGIAVRASSVNGYASLVDRGVNAQVYGLATVAATAGVRGDNTNNSANATGVYGTATGTTAQVYGVRGVINSDSFNAAGVRGETSGSQSAGVLGSSTASNGYGIRASASGSNGTGVYTYGTRYGMISYGNDYGVYGAGLYAVYGESSGSDGAGVYASAESNSPAIYGNQYDSGPGVLGVGYVVGVSGTATETGVYGQAAAANGIAGRFIAGATTGGNTGVWASTNSSSGIAGRFTGGSRGIVAEGAPIGVSASGSSYGVFATGNSYGVYATGNSSGVYATGSGYGIYAVANFIGVHGQNSDIGGYGVRGQSTVSDSSGVYGYSSSTNSRGVYGYAGGTSSRGVYGYAASPTSYGGYFENTAATGGNAGAALYVNGSIFLGQVAGTFSVIASALSPVSSYVLNNSYVNSTDEIMITPRSNLGDTAYWISSVANGSFTISFSPSLTVSKTFSYLIIGD